MHETPGLSADCQRSGTLIELPSSSGMHASMKNGLHCLNVVPLACEDRFNHHPEIGGLEFGVSLQGKQDTLTVSCSSPTRASYLELQGRTRPGNLQKVLKTASAFKAFDLHVARNVDDSAGPVNP